MRFNLYIIGSWDGSNLVWGPDLWSLQVRGAQRLFLTSFCNMGDYVNNNVQSYPDEYPWGLHQAWTGATEKNTLTFPRNGGPSTLNDQLNDSVYSIDVIFPHSEKSLILDASGIYNDPPHENQTWGIGNLEIVTMMTPPVVEESELPSLWEDLASPSPAKAYIALWKMVSAGDRIIDFFRPKIEVLQTSPMPIAGREALRLHRVQRIIQILNGKGAKLSFMIDHMLPEYFRDLNVDP